MTGFAIVRKAAVGILLGIVISAIYGYVTVNRYPSYKLVDLAIYPEDAAYWFKFMPWLSNVAIDTLSRRDADRIVNEYSSLGMTLYSGGVGYRSVATMGSKNRSDSERARVATITNILLNKGIGVTAPVDAYGCTSVHQALIAHDIESARLLLSLISANDIGGVADANMYFVGYQHRNWRTGRDIPAYKFHSGISLTSLSTTRGRLKSAMQWPAITQ